MAAKKRRGGGNFYKGEARVTRNPARRPPAPAAVRRGAAHRNPGADVQTGAARVAAEPVSTPASPAQQYAASPHVSHSC